MYKAMQAKRCVATLLPKVEAVSMHIRLILRHALTQC